MFDTFTRRIFGVLALDASTFEDVEHDTRAGVQAGVVVIAASLGAGLANLGLDPSAGGLATGVLASLAAWILWALTITTLGTRVLPQAGTEATTGQLLRTLGFAAAPGVFRLFEALGGARWFLLPLTSIWMLAAMTVAVRQALDYSSTTRAVAVCAMGWVLWMILGAGVGVWFATPVS